MYITCVCVHTHTLVYIYIYIYIYTYIYIYVCAGSIPGFVRYRSIPEFCSILDTQFLRCTSNIHIEHSSQ